MRARSFHRLVLLALALCAGCPKGPVTTTSTTSGAEAIQVGKLARAVRAADRRIIDADPDDGGRAELDVAFLALSRRTGALEAL